QGARLGSARLGMGSPRRLLLISNSTLPGGGYLGHCQQHIQSFLGQNVRRVLFIPYALHDRDAYARTAREKFESLGYGLDSIHESCDPVEAVRKSEAIFIGGGNTFRLLKALYDNCLIHEIRKRVLEDGIPYMGSSAGTNVATVSINTTNDINPLNP
uniref:Alpha-aspartyl dipeptidase n=1 Tax=Zonotrichia albicollis TaxID=44394 RepID=A0A8D2QK78_ZONAL